MDDEGYCAECGEEWYTVCRHGDPDHDQDIRAMQRAQSWVGVESVRRGLQERDRWTRRAAAAYEETASRYGRQTYIRQ